MSILLTQNHFQDKNIAENFAESQSQIRLNIIKLYLKTCIILIYLKFQIIIYVLVMH